MSETVYRNLNFLEHAYSSPYYRSSKSSGISTYDPSKRANRYQRSSKLLLKAEKAAARGNPYGNYKSPYYDPVARHERYMRERSSLGIGNGFSGKSGKGSSGKSGKGSSGGSGKGSKGRGSGNKANISAAIQKLREESALNTDAQREAAQRKIRDLQSELRQQVLKLQNMTEDNDSGINVSEIRGRIQAIRDQIQQTGGDLNKWISHEKDALERRIAAVYKANGKKYTPRLQADNERASKKRNKEVNSRADAIYKSKSKK